MINNIDPTTADGLTCRRYQGPLQRCAHDGQAVLALVDPPSNPNALTESGAPFLFVGTPEEVSAEIIRLGLTPLPAEQATP